MKVKSFICLLAKGFRKDISRSLADWGGTRHAHTPATAHGVVWRRLLPHVAYAETCGLMPECTLSHLLDGHVTFLVATAPPGLANLAPVLLVLVAIA